MSKIIFHFILVCFVVTLVDLSPVCRSVKGVTTDWCCVKGKWYRNRARINFSKLYLCQCSKCVNGVQKTYYNDCECDSKTTTSTTTTTTTTTTTPGCTKQDEYEGKSGNWCYGAKCIDGKLVYWDNFNCVETLTPTTTPSTTTPTTTPGCTKDDEYEGKSGNWCYGAKCIDGELVHWDNFTCGEITSTKSSTTTPTTTTVKTTTPLQCLHEGRHYTPGTWIERTTCGGLYCDENGNLIHYDTKEFFEGADCIPFSETTVKVSSTERTITSTVRP